MSEPIERAAARLREAVAAGSFVEAATRASDYCQAVEERVRRPHSDDRLEDLRRQALELLEWARRAALAHRAHCAAQLAALPDLRPYRPPATSPHAWDVEA